MPLRLAFWFCWFWWLLSPAVQVTWTRRRNGCVVHRLVVFLYFYFHSPSVNSWVTMLSSSSASAMSIACPTRPAEPPQYRRRLQTEKPNETLQFCYKATATARDWQRLAVRTLRNRRLFTAIVIPSPLAYNVHKRNVWYVAAVTAAQQP